MLSYRKEIKDSWVRSEPSSRSLAALLGMTTPTTLRDIVDRLHFVETIVRESNIDTDDDAAISGYVKMELHSDGTFRFSGHMMSSLLRQVSGATPSPPNVRAVSAALRRRR